MKAAKVAPHVEAEVPEKKEFPTAVIPLKPGDKTPAKRVTESTTVDLRGILLDYKTTADMRQPGEAIPLGSLPNSFLNSFKELIDRVQSMGSPVRPFGPFHFFFESKQEPLPISKNSHSLVPVNTSIGFHLPRHFKSSLTST